MAKMESSELDFENYTDRENDEVRPSVCIHMSSGINGQLRKIAAVNLFGCFLLLIQHNIF